MQPKLLLILVLSLAGYQLVSASEFEAGQLDRLLADLQQLNSQVQQPNPNQKRILLAELLGRTGERWSSAARALEPRERRLVANPIMGGQRLTSGALLTQGERSAIESLSSLLDESGSSRLNRAYKPKTMSTARGFGKRARWDAD